MRPLRLDLAGFTAFREPTTLDFTDADFFALVGPTGSGKSSVLDAICFALYGTVPRWNDRRAVSNALAPSAAEARVRLIFESGGLRYAATRVVRRDGKGRVTTGHAGLELLPRGFDLGKLDTGLDAGDLGDPLAGTPSEMEAAVLGAVGLPFEQFTSCVLLPQGQFAEFLHAKPAVRQQIMVNLLGLSIYERVREQATEVARQADAHLAATDSQLTDLAGAAEQVGPAADRLAEMERLVAETETATPVLALAQAEASTARQALQTLDGELKRLAGVAAPGGTADLSAALATARTAQREAEAVVGAAEDHEQKLRDELTAAGDAARLRELLVSYSDRGSLAEQVAAMDEALEAADAEHAAATEALAAAGARADQAAHALAEADAAIEEARTADRAASLRPHLVAGEPCPVCTQVVAVLPDAAEAPRLTAAQAAHGRARDAVRAAQEQAATRDRELRDIETALAGVRAQHAALTSRVAELDSRLAGAPDPQELRDTLRGITELQLELEEAAASVRGAREALRRAGTEVSGAEQRVQQAWRIFDTARDGVASFGPPAADREDLAAAWATLTEWAAGQSAARVHGRAAAVEVVRTTAAAVDTAEHRIVTMLQAAGLTTTAGTDHARVAAVAAEQARATHARLVERKEQAERLRAARSGHEHESRTAKALAQHLRANNFERWLLAEALDTLVDGASRILRELSGGQYDLGHDKGEFYVVDHHDAGLQRPVRTLSGGETFQASLSLALALSEQLAALSTSAASLESIMLDEGFGTLDATTLDTVAATLENLAARGDRMVGVVTHVAALAERIPVRFEVHKDARSSRVTRVG
ncbi:MAG TPA: SMC family ATPase [Micromonosporaceae bacterium]|nr:SMC family ATPase [Micromonosporaceae bacterium]